jgi:citrate synthase
MPSRAGSPNKNKAFLLNRLQDMYGEDFHPIMQAAANAKMLHDKARSTEDPNDLKASIDAWDKIAQYTEPKLKATEIHLDANIKATEVDMTGVSDEPEPADGDLFGD